MQFGKGLHKSVTHVLLNLKNSVTLASNLIFIEAWHCIR